MGTAPSLAPPESPSCPSTPNTDLLFKEAKQRERRRRLAWLGLAVIVVGAIAAICMTVAGTFNTGTSERLLGHGPANLPLASAGFPPCSSDSLRAAVTLTSDSSVQLNATLLTVTNESSSVCELFTFPVLQLVDGAGKVMATAPPPGQVDVRVRIPPGSSAIANLFWQNWCGTARLPLALHVVLPDESGTISAPFGGPTSSLPSCTASSNPTSLVATGGLDSGSLFGTGR
jgi:hypothetical protein